MFKRIRISHAFVFALAGTFAISIYTTAQTPAATGPVMRYTASTMNVSGAPDSVRIDVLAWSSEADRDQLVGAWNLTPTAAAAGARGAGGARGERGAGGGARGERGAAPEAAAGQANPAQAAAGAAGAAGAGGGGRGAGGGGGGGGRGGGRGGAGAAADAAPQTPPAALAAALQTAKTVGYLWTSESAGYSLRYAYRMPQPDGTERIIFATERRLGAWNNLWKPTGAANTDYEFSLIELHLNARGEGEGKTSLTGKVTVDATAKTLALDGYATLPIVLKDVKRKAN